jgi:hypothetical protein
MKKPRSPYDPVSGAVYFARMLDKVRLRASNTLHEDYHSNMGTGMDGRMCRFLRVDFEALSREVRAGKSDDEAWEWCMQNGRRFNADDVEIWNGFVSKRGWNDGATKSLEEAKAKSGLAGRDDLRTYFEYYEVDEGRRP